MKEKQIDIITDLLIDFDEMGFAPTTAVPDPDAYAIEWRNKLTNALQGYRKKRDDKDTNVPNKWISVEDRLPTDQKEVLCYYGFDRGDGDLGMMFIGTLCYFCFDKNPHWQHADNNLVVTHWMPLPDAPKGGEW